MKIICNNDVIDISKVEYVEVKDVKEYELKKLEEECNGEYTSEYLWAYLYSLDVDGAPSSAIASKIEKMLNKYWYEVGLLLPQPKSEPNARKRWEYDPYKRSSFSVGWIDSYGEAVVKWSFTADCGSNPAGGRYSMDEDTELSLRDDIMPIVKSLTQEATYQKVKQKSGYASGLVQLALEILLPDSFGNSGNDVQATPTEIKRDMGSVYREWDDTYGNVMKKKRDVEARKTKRNKFLRKYTGKSVLIVETRDGCKKYLDGHCGFDIFAKQQELENALELYRRQRTAKIKSEKAALVAEITDEFYARDLLSRASLSNNEKIKEYAALCEFCFKYIPALTDRSFRVEDLHEEYHDFVSEEACTAFNENWVRLNRSYSALKRGVMGEDKVYEVLSLFDDRIRILRDYVCECERGFHEHDFIVITPQGISTIEVKNLRGSYELTETGMLKCKSCNKVTPKDVALQSKKHLETLRRSLRGCPSFSYDIPLQEIICSAESNYTIKDSYHHIPICYYNTVDKVLLPSNGEAVLDERAMDEIERYLLQNKREAFVFDVFGPRGEIDSREDFIRSFAEVAAVYMATQSV